MKKPLIYITRAIPGDAVSMLSRKDFDVEVNPEDRLLTHEELIKNVKGKDGVICQMADRIDREVMNAAAGVKGFANYAVGFDNIDLKAATDLKIPVSNTPDVLTDATAEMAWSLLFSVCRRTAELDRFVREGKWINTAGPSMFLGGSITGKTIGIIGAGRIGTAFALKSRGFDMKILYTGRRKNSIIDDIKGSEKVELDELMKRSDFISLHIPSTEETYHLIGEKELSLMKKGAYLINTARGAVVDEKALLKALKNRWIAGAALDVFEKEPEITEGLTKLDNIVFTPHVGSATIEARNNMGLKAAENITAMIKGEKAPDCLNPEIYGA